MVMMGEAKSCQKVYHVPKNACDNRECAIDCRGTYGAASSGRCGGQNKPDDICVCTYPC
ncbi:hypothetical protein FH972_006400 [Carpinus fangiana]|uniref:Knottin scorpion toxin-like domain-containing protein n=1 Tax=Carpinus fangiana TaxID=176857 RepID=A0A5N6QVN8_9ROSI|nr:hypothetical protein FH972_006400 [Carpinus fangiana]